MDYPLKTPDQLRQQIRSLRKQRQLTQTGLGALLGVTQARVVEIEANPGAVNLQQIMQVLNALGAGLVVRDPQPDSPADERPPIRQLPSPAPDTRANAQATRIKKGSW